MNHVERTVCFGMWKGTPNVAQQQQKATKILEVKDLVPQKEETPRKNVSNWAWGKILTLGFVILFCEWFETSSRAYPYYMWAEHNCRHTAKPQLQPSASVGAARTLKPWCHYIWLCLLKNLRIKIKFCFKLFCFKPNLDVPRAFIL